MVFWTDENSANDPSTDEKIGDDSGSDGARPDAVVDDSPAGGHGNDDPATGDAPDGQTTSEEDTVTVGVCSECGASLPRPNVVIEYETGDEWEQVALCPECQTLAVA